MRRFRATRKSLDASLPPHLSDERIRCPAGPAAGGGGDKPLTGSCVHKVRWVGAVCHILFFSFQVPGCDRRCLGRQTLAEKKRTYGPQRDQNHGNRCPVGKVGLASRTRTWATRIPTERIPARHLATDAAAHLAITYRDLSLGSQVRLDHQLLASAESRYRAVAVGTPQVNAVLLVPLHDFCCWLAI
jgi:hypothetical protein